jgi:hypothetical protein
MGLGTAVCDFINWTGAGPYINGAGDGIMKGTDKAKGVVKKGAGKVAQGFKDCAPKQAKNGVNPGAEGTWGGENKKMRRHHGEVGMNLSDRTGHGHEKQVAACPHAAQANDLRAMAMSRGIC